jgi:hypothetical protein
VFVIKGVRVVELRPNPLILSVMLPVLLERREAHEPRWGRSKGRLDHSNETAVVQARDLECRSIILGYSSPTDRHSDAYGGLGPAILRGEQRTLGVENVGNVGAARAMCETV